MGIKFDLPTLTALTENLPLPEEDEGASPQLPRWFIPARGRRTLALKVVRALKRLDHRLEGVLQFDPLLTRMRSEEVVNGRAGVETCREIARLAVRADRSWMEVKRLFEDARGKAKQQRWREPKSRGGSHRDTVRAVIVKRIVHWLNQSEEVRGSREIWESFRCGRMRIPGGIIVRTATDDDGIEDERRAVITGPDRASKSITYVSFRRYVTEARRAERTAQ